MKLELCANRDIYIEPYPANPLGESDVQYMRSETPKHDDYSPAAEAEYWKALANALKFAGITMDEMQRSPVIGSPEPLFTASTVAQPVETTATTISIQSAGALVAQQAVEMEYAA